MKFFTVLIAVYNGADYLAAALDSLLTQDEKDIQVICIDDCSTDGTADILRSYAARDSRVEVLRTAANGGQAAARKLGLAQAVGRFTLHLDADDLLAPGALRAIRETAEAHPEADSVVMRLVRFWPDGTRLVWPWPDERRRLTGREACLLSVDWQLHGCAAFRTGLMRQYVTSSPLRAYADDNDARLYYLHSRSVALCEAAYLYRQHTASVTHSFSLLRLDFVDANRALRRLLTEHEAGREALCRCERHCWSVFVGVHRELAARRASLTQQEWREARRRMAVALAEMRPSRLPLRVSLHPSTLFLRPYIVFRAWQGLILALRPLLRGRGD